jgi:hypothetical protein
MLAACSGEKKQDTLAQDSLLNQDMQLANGDTAISPALNDVPSQSNAPAPAKSTPSRSSSSSSSRSNTTASGNKVTSNTAKETSVGTIPAGTTLNLSSASRICTNTNKVGQTVTATTRESVTGSNGAVIPAGATVSLEITELKRSENVKDKISMGFAVRSISFGGHTYPVSATVADAQVDRVRNESKGKDAQKVATGTAVGAAIGQILGHNTKSTVIGGAIGAAAGAGAAATTANYEGCVPEGGKITISLSSPVQVRT